MQSSTRLRKKPQTPRKLATRAKICEAARGLFFEHGFDGTTVEQIASAAGTRRSTLYTHFRDKDEILGALIDDYAVLVGDLIAQLPSPTPSREDLDQWILAFAQLAASEQVPTILLMQAGSTTRAPEAVQRFGAMMFAGLSRQLPAFQEAMSTGVGIARAQAVLRQLGWSLVHYADDPRSGVDHLTVAGEWLWAFIHRGPAG